MEEIKEMLVDIFYDESIAFMCFKMTMVILLRIVLCVLAYFMIKMLFTLFGQKLLYVLFGFIEFVGVAVYNIRGWYNK